MINVATMGKVSPEHLQHVNNLVNIFVQEAVDYVEEHQIENGSVIIRDAILAHTVVLMQSMGKNADISVENARNNYRYMEECFCASLEKSWEDSYGDDLWTKA
jgi:hypothetical protein